MSDTPRAEIAQRGPFPLRPTRTLDVFVMGCVCDGGCCRPIVQMLHGRVYAAGDAFMAWHLPTNPAQVNAITFADSASANAQSAVWAALADATEQIPAYPSSTYGSEDH